MNSHVYPFSLMYCLLPQNDHGSINILSKNERDDYISSSVSTIIVMCCNKKSSQLCRYLNRHLALMLQLFTLMYLVEDIEAGKHWENIILLKSNCCWICPTHHYLNDKSVKELLFFAHSLQVQCTSNFIVTKNVTLFLVVSPRLATPNLSTIYQPFPSYFFHTEDLPQLSRS